MRSESYDGKFEMDLSASQQLHRVQNALLHGRADSTSDDEARRKSTLSDSTNTSQTSSASGDYVFKLQKTGDIYALGVMLWELWMLQRPYPHFKWEQIVLAVVHDGMRPVPPNQAKVASIPPRLLELIRSCWADRPSDRPSTDQILQELRHNKQLLDFDTEKPPKMTGLMSRVKSRRELTRVRTAMPVSTNLGARERISFAASNPMHSHPSRTNSASAEDDEHSPKRHQAAGHYGGHGYNGNNLFQQRRLPPPETPQQQHSSADHKLSRNASDVAAWTARLDGNNADV